MIILKNEAGIEFVVEPEYVRWSREALGCLEKQTFRGLWCYCISGSGLDTACVTVIWWTTLDYYWMIKAQIKTNYSSEYRDIKQRKYFEVPR